MYSTNLSIIKAKYIYVISNIYLAKIFNSSLYVHWKFINSKESVFFKISYVSICNIFLYNTSFSKSGIDNMFTLAGSGYIYGNIMSLLESSTFATATELKADAVFYQLFRNQTALYSHPTNELVLPATTLTAQCFFSMFQDCRNLTKAPDLPATTLAQQCYFSMFSHCSNLTKAPDLPATTLADQCYAHMFDRCTNLTKAPDLPATTLANLCYIRMFDGCTSLNSIKCLATDIPAIVCTSGWLDGVAATGTFTKAASMNDWPTGTSGIPEGWTVVDE